PRPFFCFRDRPSRTGSPPARWRSTVTASPPAVDVKAPQVAEVAGGDNGDLRGRFQDPPLAFQPRIKHRSGASAPVAAPGVAALPHAPRAGHPPAVQARGDDGWAMEMRVLRPSASPAVENRTAAGDSTCFVAAIVPRSVPVRTLGDSVRPFISTSCVNATF